jgi:Methyltransferase domain
MTEFITDPDYENKEDQTDIALHMPLLTDLARNATCVLELGCGHGNGSTRALARGLERMPPSEYLYVSVDQDYSRPQIRPDLANWRTVTGDTTAQSTVRRVNTVLDNFGPPGAEGFDLIFVDTDHSKAQLERELELWSEVASNWATWIFHDTWMFGFYNPMTEAITEFCAIHPQWRYRELTKESHGLWVMQGSES